MPRGDPARNAVVKRLTRLREQHRIIGKKIADNEAILEVIERVAREPEAEVGVRLSRPQG